MDTKQATKLKIEGKLEELNAKIKEWEGRAKQGAADALAEREKLLADLRRKRDAVADRLSAWAKAGEAGAEKAREAAESAWGQLEETADKARKMFTR